MDYFELLKGSGGGTKPQEGWFSELLMECTESAKESNVDEGVDSAGVEYKIEKGQEFLYAGAPYKIVDFDDETVKAVRVDLPDKRRNWDRKGLELMFASPEDSGIGESKVDEVDETAGLGCPQCSSQDIGYVEGDVYECHGCETKWHQETGELVEESKVNESKPIKEYLDATRLVAYLDDSYSRKVFEEDPDYDAEDLWYTLGDLIAKVRKVLIIVDAYVIKHDISRVSELPGEFPTLWLETSDGFEMAAEGDYSALQELLQEVVAYGDPATHEGESSDLKFESKVAEVANLRDEASPAVDTHGQKIKKGDAVEVVGAAPEAEKGGVWIVDDLEEVATDKWNVWVHRKDDVEVTDDFWAHKLELAESKVNELDEPDLERPEKARKRGLKRKRPRKPEPDQPLGDEPEEPKEKPREEPSLEPEEKPKLKPDTPEEVPEIDMDPDREDVPPPPEEILPPEQPIEMRKEYLGRSEDTHFYFVTFEGEGGTIEDLVVADQEGVKKYSARDKDIEVTEENIADFIVDAIRDVKIAQIERSIFMKYVYPRLELYAPEEEMLEEPIEDEEFGDDKKKPFGKEDEERRIAASKTKYVSAKFLLEKWDARESKNLIEMQVIDGMGNEFAVTLADDGTSDAVVNINGREFRFSGEFASMWRDEEGGISDEGLEELALDALAMMEEDEYQVLMAKNAEETEGSKPEFVSKEEDGLVSLKTRDWKKSEKPEPEKEDDMSAPPIAPATDDVDLSRAEVVEEPIGGDKKSGGPVPKKYTEEEQWKRRQEDHDVIAGPGRQSKYRAKKGVPDQAPGESVENENIRDEIDEKVDPRRGELSKALRNKGYVILGSHTTQEGGVKSAHHIIRADTPEESKLTDAQAGEIHRIVKSSMPDATIKHSEYDVEVTVVKENEIVKGDNEMSKLSEFTDEQLLSELTDRKEKSEGIAPDPKDSQENIIKKLLEEVGINETDVAKGTKALVTLAKEALKDGDYAKLGEYAIKLAEIEAMIPAEAESEAEKLPDEKDDKAPKKKDDKEDDKPKEDDKKDDKPEKKDDLPVWLEKDDVAPEKKDDADEKKSPPHCDKCDKSHWPFDKCPGPEAGVDEAKKDDVAKAKKAKKDKEDKAKKDKKEKEDKEAKVKKDKKDKEDKAKKDKKESRIPVESTEDITEKKSMETLKDLLGLKD